MFPGLRLIAVSFLCGFVVVFIGLRAVFSLNNVHSSLPVMAAQAAQSVPPGMIEPRGAPSAMPALYDFRLVASAVTPQFASLTVPMIERVLPDPVPLIEDAIKEFPPALADKPTPQADAANERQAAIAVEPPPVEPAAITPIEPPIATPVEPQPMSDSAGSERPPELSLQPISQSTAPLESRLAAIATDPDAAAAVVEAPKPAEAKLTKATAKPARKKRVRVARRAPPQNGSGNGGANLFGKPGGNSFGNPSANSFGNSGRNSFGNAGRNSFGNPAANSSGYR